MNNLYGGSQAEALPISDFKWHEDPQKFMDPNFIKKLTPDDPVGYWLECDIDFKKRLHRKRAFNCYPPLPETKVITYKMLSPKAKKLLIDKVGKSAAKNYKSKKLISTLENKRKYKIHYLNLQQAMKFGCKLKKVHKVLSFKQKKFSKNFLNFMTERRKNSRTKLEERLCKGKHLFCSRHCNLLIILSFFFAIIIFRHCQSTIREIDRESPRPFEVTFCQNTLAVE